MLDDYKMMGTTKEIQISVEEEVAVTLAAMAQYSGINASELTNTALKRFISHHKDFLPPAPMKR